MLGIVVGLAPSQNCQTLFFFAMKTSNSSALRQSLFTRTMKTCGVMLIALPMFCGCIYDTPKGDMFYRTLWTSEEFPYGSITLEFLCGNNVNIKGVKAIGSYGHYDPVERTAYFSSLDLKYEIDKKVSIIIEEAYRSGDNMQLIWHLNDSDQPHSTTMTRLKAYQ